MNGSQIGAIVSWHLVEVQHMLTPQIVIIIVAILLVLFSTWQYLRAKKARQQTPKFIPGFLQKRWQAWKPRQKYTSVESGGRAGLNANTSYNGAETEERAATQAAAAGVDRNTSIRSVMTLPAYSSNPQDTEQVLGREGERAGMDTVVEFPETNDEEEGRRQEQMDSLYRIRLHRRAELDERERRRQERQEAREAGNFARLEELRRESRLRANNQSETDVNGGLSVSAATMLAEHQSRSRDRRVSSVTYADIGHVRHDGTRIRANSTESERGGLLDYAAPMADDANSLHPSTIRTGRERSGSSALSISTNASDNDAQPTPATTQAHSSSDANTSDSSPTAHRFTPEGSTEGEDIGDVHITTLDSPQPPGYQPPEEWGDAPAYSAQRESVRRAAEAEARGVQRTRSQRAFEEMSRASTVQRESGPPQLPALDLPSISVETASAPGSPVSAQESQRGREERRSRWGGNEEFMS